MHGYQLADFGSYTVGGHIHTVSQGTVQTINFTRDVSFEYDPRGDFAVAHSYVQYFIPVARNELPPVVLVHGGGLSGAFWETTPDGRPGWLHLLLQRGFEVHVIDLVERGRSGFAPQIFNGEPILRSLNEAWSLFRFGKAEDFAQRKTFNHCQFPANSLEALARLFVPRWLGTSAMQVAAVSALLEKLGNSILICHSQGAEISFDAIQCASATVSTVIAIEPSSAPQSLDRYGQTTLVIVQGDYLSINDIWRSRAASWAAIIAELSVHSPRSALIDLPSTLGSGNTHLPMLDNNSDKCLEISLQAAGLA